MRCHINLPWESKYILVERSWVMLGLSSKGINTIDMMSYGWGEQPVRLVGFEFKIGYKERIHIEND